MLDSKEAQSLFKKRINNPQREDRSRYCSRVKEDRNVLLHV